MMLTEWWTQFGSVTLTNFIDTALANSPTVDAALARVMQARGVAGGEMAALMPKIGATGGLSRSGNNTTASINGKSVITDLTSGAQTSFDGGQTTVDHSTLTNRSRSLDMSWEIDLFGGRRRRIEASQAFFEARVADWRSARLVLVSEIASTYALRRHCEVLLNISNADYISRTETHRLTLQKRDAGFVIPADADRTEGSVAEAASSVTGLQAECAIYQNQLVALTGLTYPEVGKRLGVEADSLPTPPAGALPIVPAIAISQRPDISASERNLAAASANIGVAKAAALPSISLIGSIGVNVGWGTSRNSTAYDGSDAQTNNGTYNTIARSWSFGPSISLPIFDGGRAAADIEYAKAAFLEASAHYQASVRNAVLEVENALVRLDSTSRRMGNIERAHNGYTSFFAATDAQYRVGVASLLALEEARRVLLASRQALVSERLAQIQAWITLFKAVGGGWKNEEAPITPGLLNPIPITTTTLH